MELQSGVSLEGPDLFRAGKAAPLDYGSFRLTTQVCGSMSLLENKRVWTLLVDSQVEDIQQITL